MHRALLLLLGMAAIARGATWTSTALKAELPVRVIEPARSVSSSAPPAVVYLENLGSARVGRESDDAILSGFHTEGYLIAVIDYQHRPEARWPLINREIAGLRDAIQKRTFFAGHPVDLAHVYMIPAGDRLQRDVVFYRDEQRTLAMDIVYPSQPREPVGALLEFSCDNANRMSNYSLDVCSDSLLESSATEGYAVAMADHPVAAPYKGLDPMPDCARKIKAAVRTLRHEGDRFGFNGRIVSVGFSRGSGMALMLVTTLGRPEFDGFGEHVGVDSSVQGAIVLSGRFTYLDLLPNDHMIPRYTAAWGDRAGHEARWRAEGALDYLTQPTLPIYLSINCSESPDALHQMDVLRQRLDALHSPYEYHPENTPRGHKVPLDGDVLDPMLAYLRRQLTPVRVK